MAGICATLGPYADEHIKEICESLQHRGPDDEGYHFDKNLALGHRALRLGNTPIVHQPLANEDDSLWITLDGEIYNRASITQQLQKKHTLETESSAEIVAHAYEEDGFKCLNKLNGVFAFCLWDSKNHLLFSARDRLGVKPLYYFKQKNISILSSEIKGILTQPLVSRQPNKRFIYTYLLTGYPPRTGQTFFEQIAELMPAHYMIMDKKGIEIRKYWTPLSSTESHLPAKDDQSYASHLRQLLHDSISIQMPSDLSVGTFVSGGLDSTCIAFLVDEILTLNDSERSPETKSSQCQEIFSAVYKDPTEQGDEKVFIEEVERSLKAQINYIVPSVAGKWNDIKQFVSCIEEPVAVFNYYVFWCLYQAAGQKVKNVYIGQGADAILGGQWTHAMAYLKELLHKKEIGKYIKELSASVDWILPYVAYSLLFRRDEESKAKKLLSRDFIAAYGSNVVPREDSTLQDALLEDVTQHAVEYLRVDDRSSLANSIECRHPFLDHRIVEFAFSLPSTQKIRNGWTKYVLRNAMKGLVPDLIRKKRRKSGTPIPQQRWMKELKEDIRRLLESDKFRERGYFNQAAVLDVFDRYCEGKLNRLERQYYKDLLWRILNLELWLQHFFKPDNELQLT